jgi:glutamate dehydrogenase (NADP+)
MSGLEMSQNSARIAWGEAELQGKLRDLMQGIHDRCLQYGVEDGDPDGSGHCDYVKGANIAGFKKVADAMLAYGVV